MRNRRTNQPITGAAALRILETPLTVIDFETTGLDAGVDRVVEVCIARIEPGGAPRVVLDTLVNPGRRVAATFVHGITDADVLHAPSFAEIVPQVIEAVGGSVVTAYNAAFDMRFLRDELTRCGLAQTPPYLCLMYLKPLLGLGMRCGLRQACEHFGVKHTGEHHAAIDVTASANILMKYLEAIGEREIQTFHDLSRMKRYKFFESLKNELLQSTAGSAFAVNDGLTAGSAAVKPLCSRSQRPRIDLEACA